MSSYSRRWSIGRVLQTTRPTERGMQYFHELVPLSRAAAQELSWNADACHKALLRTIARATVMS